MSRLPGCSRQQEDLRRRPLQRCWIERAAHRWPEAVADRRVRRADAEGRQARPEGQVDHRPGAAFHAAQLRRPVPPWRQQCLLHAADGYADGVLAHLPLRLHAAERRRLLLRAREPGHEADELLLRPRPCDRVALVVPSPVARTRATLARLVRPDLQRARGAR